MQMMKRPARYLPRTTGNQPIGGAIPSVQNRFKLGQMAAQRAEFPIMAANIYAPPSVVTLPMEVQSMGDGMMDRIYQPAESPTVAASKDRSFGEKFGNWLQKGRFV